MLTQEKLKEILHYNSDTGHFTWLSATKGRIHNDRIRNSRNVRLVGKLAGSFHKASGYIIISIDSVRYKAHRLAILYIYGFLPCFPDQEVDHLSHNRGDNSLKNLRVTTRKGNSKNNKKQERNKSGFTGVLWYEPSGKWKAQIRANGTVKNLGHFDTIEDAISARKKANIKYGYHANHGV